MYIIGTYHRLRFALPPLGPPHLWYFLRREGVRIHVYVPHFKLKLRSHAGCGCGGRPFPTTRGMTRGVVMGYISLLVPCSAPQSGSSSCQLFVCSPLFSVHNHTTKAAEKQKPPSRSRRHHVHVYFQRAMAAAKRKLFPSHCWKILWSPMPSRVPRGILTSLLAKIVQWMHIL